MDNRYSKVIHGFSTACGVGVPNPPLIVPGSIYKLLSGHFDNSKYAYSNYFVDSHKNEKKRFKIFALPRTPGNLSLYSTASNPIIPLVHSPTEIIQNQ